MQPDYAIVSSMGAHIAQPGQMQHPQPLTNFLDIVSTSPLHVLEDIVQKDVGVVHQKGELNNVYIFMVALCNRADHYIFALWFLSAFFVLPSFFGLISAVRDWMSTILPHMVWP